MEIGVEDAAERLQMSPATVRRLAESGELAARKVSGRWLIAESDVAARARQHRGPGRPVSARSAWAILELLDGISPVGLSRSELARARDRAMHARRLAPGDLASRARVHRLRGPRGVQDHLLRDRRLVRSGVSASAGVGIVAFDLVEGYVRPSAVDTLIRKYGLRPAAVAESNVILRVPEPRWPFGDADEAPRSVVAVDFLDAGDSRSVREARRVLAGLARALEA